MRRLAAVLLVLAMGVAFTTRSSTSEAPLRYTIRDLGTVLTTPRSINASGQVAGSGYVGAKQHAFRFTDGAGVVDLGMLGGDTALAVGINSQGDTVGYATTGTTTGSPYHAFRFTDSGGMQDLATAGGASSFALGINDSGQIAGYSDVTAGGRHAIRYSTATGYQDLGTLGGFGSLGLAISSSGAITGYSMLAGVTGYHAFRYIDGTPMQDLGTLGGNNSQGNGINASGTVVGWARLTGNGSSHAFRFDDTLEDLGTLGGGSSSAEAINDAGVIVGSAQTASTESHAFVWTPTRGMIDLNTTIDAASWLLVSAGAINDAGQIAGYGVLGGTIHGFLLTPDAVTDTTPPVIAVSVSPSPNAAGWNNHAVTVTFTVSDPESNIATTSGCDTVTIGTETPGTTFTCTARNGAGLEASAVQVVKIDMTAPRIVTSRAPAPNAAGWNNSEVTVTFKCEDNLSGVTGCPAMQLFNQEGAGFSTTGLATDVAGNQAQATVAGINIDRTAPMVSCGASPGVLWPANHQLVPVTISLDVSDMTSGAAGVALLSVASSEPLGPGDIQGFTVGTFLATAGAAATSGLLRAEKGTANAARLYKLTYAGFDVAGNSATCAAVVMVPHDSGNGATAAVRTVPRKR